jgi:hypothetical protein
VLQGGDFSERLISRKRKSRQSSKEAPAFDLLSTIFSTNAENSSF